MLENITGVDFIKGCSAIGAGIAMIAGIGPGVINNDSGQNENNT